MAAEQYTAAFSRSPIARRWANASTAIGMLHDRGPRVCGQVRGSTQLIGHIQVAKLT
jgi:hypothetical protein